MEIVRLLQNYEEKFRCNKYNGELYKGKPYEFIKGEGDVIVSAPHSVNHVREGELKVADLLTGAFALYLNSVTKCHIFFRTYNDNKDPNYDDENSDGGYKKKLEEIVKHNHIKCLIDLHASTENRPFDIDMGTNDSKSLNGYNFVTDIIKTIALINNISDVTHNKVFSAPVNTVSNFISSVSEIPCVQLEINRKYRDYERVENLERITKTLVEVITTLKNVNWSQKEQFVLNVVKGDFHIPQDKVSLSIDGWEKIIYNKPL